MTGARDWQGQVGASWAAEWQRTDRSLAPVNAALVARAAPARRILDIGCGAGATSLGLAAALPDAQILGIDLSPALIEAARARATAVPRCQFSVADATEWEDHSFAPDLLVSRHGVMFFTDPVAAFGHLAAQAARPARLLFSCFRARAENEWAEQLPALLGAVPPVIAGAPGPFAFAEHDHVARILAAAGWRDARCEPLDFSYVAGAGDDPIADALAFFSRIGPAAPLIRALPESERLDFQKRFEQLAQNRLENGEVRFRAAAAIWTAQRP